MCRICGGRGYTMDAHPYGMGTATERTPCDCQERKWCSKCDGALETSIFGGEPYCPHCERGDDDE